MDIKILMQKLNITEAEAKQLAEDDKKIDKGEKLFEQTTEQKKATKKATNVSRSVDAYGKKRIREHKTDIDKKYLIDMIAGNFYQIDIDFKVTNAEREIELTYNGRNFKIVLSAPRKKSQ